MIITGLIDSPLIDYDDPAQKPLLLSLASKVSEYYRSFARDEKHLKSMLSSRTSDIAKAIYTQMSEHKVITGAGYTQSLIRGSRSILPFNYSRVSALVTLESQRDSFSADFCYTEFNKACHSVYRFDSSPEVRFAYLCERDPHVKAWIRPAP